MGHGKHHGTMGTDDQVTRDDMMDHGMSVCVIKSNFSLPLLYHSQSLMYMLLLSVPAFCSLLILAFFLVIDNWLVMQPQDPFYRTFAASRLCFMWEKVRWVSLGQESPVLLSFHWSWYSYFESNFLLLVLSLAGGVQEHLLINTFLLILNYLLLIDTCLLLIDTYFLIYLLLICMHICIFSFLPNSLCRLIWWFILKLCSFLYSKVGSSCRTS